MSRTFVIGDVHGHIDRLDALLCRANAVHQDTQIVFLGDLGHFGKDTSAGDTDCYMLARNLNAIILWGNHDRAVVDPDNHSFRGYQHPGPSLQNWMEEQCDMRIAHAADGFLLTHAGLHPAWAYDNTMRSLSAEGWVGYLTNAPFDDPIIVNISKSRGGYDHQGGILWRDSREALYPGVKQIFGHTKGMVRQYPTNSPDGELSYCIDTGDKTNGSLVGIWTDTLQIVAVGPDAEQFEKYPPIDGYDYA